MTPLARPPSLASLASLATIAAAALAAAALATPAAAAPLSQPSGARIPSPMGCAGNRPTGLAAELACVCDPAGPCNIGAPCPSPGNCAVPTGTCETTLYHQFNDNTCIPSQLAGLDPYDDGALTPETFTPTCPLTFRLVTRGTARFGNVFGWYNVTGQAPAPAALYPMLDCNAAAGAQVVLDVRSDPRWTGGEIGFFLVTPEQHGGSGQCAGGDCCARVDRLPAAGYAYYSQRALNPDHVGADSFIHLIVYDSQIRERTFYFAWEDTSGAANNDFTDLVTSVSGVECTGGGQACATGGAGLCQYGVTACRGAAVECQQVYQPAAEVCDGADNDCDGLTDERPDGTGTLCSDDVVGNCDGVTCAAGLVCRSGVCIDPCSHVDCPAGMACLTGVCLPGCNQCGGVACGAGTTCDLGSGDCLGGPGQDAGVDASGPGDDGRTAGCCQGGGGGSGPAAIGLGLGVALWLGRRRR